jgi:hypothetical protein
MEQMALLAAAYKFLNLILQNVNINTNNIIDRFLQQLCRMQTKLSGVKSCERAVMFSPFLYFMLSQTEYD